MWRPAVPPPQRRRFTDGVITDLCHRIPSHLTACIVSKDSSTTLGVCRPSLPLCSPSASPFSLFPHLCDVVFYSACGEADPPRCGQRRLCPHQPRHKSHSTHTLPHIAFQSHRIPSSPSPLPSPPPFIGSRPYHLSHYNLRFDFIAVCDSSGYLHSTPLTDAQLTSVLTHKASKLPLHSLQPGGLPSPSPYPFPPALPDSSTILVDCAATPHTIDSLLLTLSKGGGVTGANKQALCTTYPNFARLMSPLYRPRVRYESTVGAGTPFITSLHRLLASNDTPTRIQGTFSGTLGYLCSGLEHGRSYSEVVNDAMRLGYTEPEPRDDLGGVDVARKALILARTMGWPLEMSDIDIQPLYPHSLAAVTIPQFVAALPGLDREYAEMHERAKAEGKVLRFVATIEKGKVEVGLVALAKDSPIGRLQGTENMVEYHTGIYKEKGLVVQGSGAGGEVTASGIMGDLVELAYMIGT